LKQPSVLPFGLNRATDHQHDAEFSYCMRKTMMAAEKARRAIGALPSKTGRAAPHHSAAISNGRS
jgi:hypothetical protein